MNIDYHKDEETRDVYARILAYIEAALAGIGMFTVLIAAIAFSWYWSSK